jgi:predicted CXXCH cytochrome family protein
MAAKACVGMSADAAGRSACATCHIYFTANVTVLLAAPFTTICSRCEPLVSAAGTCAFT